MTPKLVLTFLRVEKETDRALCKFVELAIAAMQARGRQPCPDESQSIAWLTTCGASVERGYHCVSVSAFVLCCMKQRPSSRGLTRGGLVPLVVTESVNMVPRGSHHP